jgi:hypothetical protein
VKRAVFLLLVVVLCAAWFAAGYMHGRLVEQWKCSPVVETYV